MDYTIRPIAEADNIVIAQVIRRVFIELGAPTTGTAYADPVLDRLSTVYDKEGTTYFVVESKGEVIGGAGIAPLDGGIANVCELQKMYFSPEARGRGIGTELMQKCLDTARQFGYSQCYIETLDSMLAAQKLYTKTGFKYLDAPLGDTGHNSCQVWMLKDL
ncbi:acetyltransferase [Flavobacterium akiainvivens]|uniref:Acetyltransferase n=1 Tax=Flavobacterium akiainvivens TaxID=1202724 RepID=A0A0N0RQB6_9FLAO|nr:GNAT family N-acetyltransferase [Flavobacterium akiainvivens]KOS04680.1 acetyltransferase [Flavobacterium akiainvivens]SFQ65081.1 putative acetyltransferase [Flavobacterium akiainvivens]